MNYQYQNNIHTNQYSNFSDYTHSQETKYKHLEYRNNLFDKSIGSTDFFQALEKELPPVFTRKVASNIIGGILSAKTLSNLDSLGKGPRDTIKVGNKMCYKREAFIEWLKNRRMY